METMMKWKMTTKTIAVFDMEHGTVSPWLEKHEHTESRKQQQLNRTRHACMALGCKQKRTMLHTLALFYARQADRIHNCISLRIRFSLDLG